MSGNRVREVLHVKYEHTRCTHAHTHTHTYTHECTRGTWQNAHKLSDAPFEMGSGYPGVRSPHAPLYWTSWKQSRLPPGLVCLDPLEGVQRPQVREEAEVIQGHKSVLPYDKGATILSSPWTRQPILLTSWGWDGKGPAGEHGNDMDKW